MKEAGTTNGTKGHAEMTLGNKLAKGRIAPLMGGVKLNRRAN